MLHRINKSYRSWNGGTFCIVVCPICRKLAGGPSHVFKFVDIFCTGIGFEEVGWSACCARVRRLGSPGGGSRVFLLRFSSVNVFPMYFRTFERFGKFTFTRGGPFLLRVLSVPPSPKACWRLGFSLHRNDPRIGGGTFTFTRNDLRFYFACSERPIERFLGFY